MVLISLRVIYWVKLKKLNKFRLIAVQTVPTVDQKVAAINNQLIAKK
jgi:hypothetical protein